MKSFEKSDINRLRNGEKVLCYTCHKYYYDVLFPNRKFANYFHCENPNCKGFVHEQKNIEVE